MLKDIGQIYQEVGAACAAVTQGPIRLSDEFIAAYTQFIVAQQQVRGGFKSVSFDANGATLQKGGSGVSITTVTNYSFAIAHVLCPLLKALKEYKSIFDQIYADQTVEKRIKISDLLRKGDAVAIADLDVRTSELTQDEQSKMKRFLTDYDWWHGGKAFGRPNDYFNSPLLACAKLVAANNGAIPTIVTHFCEDQTLFNSFAYSDALAGGGNEKHLDVALRMFTINRVKTEWCADNTDGDTTKPQTGYVANVKLRAAMPMTNNLGTDAQVVQWFKDYVYPDGKRWLDGIDTNGCAAFGGYINYLVTGGAAVARPAKFTRSLESAVKAIAKPASECFYNKDIHAVLKYLGLVGFDFKENFDEDDYQDALHAQRVIKRRLKDMGEKQIVEWDAAANQAKPNDKDPDFLTVNEFLWFVKENRQEISRIAKEKAMAKQQKKPTKEKVTTGEATISELLANKEDSLMTMLTAALLTKPLVILAGVSGTGKSRMVRHLAYKTCLDKDLQPQGGNAPGNFKMIQVKPNWHDSADLLGYRSVVSGDHEFVTTEFVKFVLKAHAYPDTPFFVCLDEMNLAPVEHYFAEFLSACESIRKNEQNVWISDPIVSPTDFDGEIINLGGDVKFESDDAALDAALKARKALIEKEGLFIPRNLFVVGTVNMDDTTNGFSRKVLDRAMTIEMNEVKFDELQKKDEGLSVAAANVFTPTEIKKFIDRADFDGQAMLNNEFRDQMEALRGKLEKSPFALAYRFARETTLYRKALMTILDPAEVVKDANGAPKKDAASALVDAERACGEIALDHMILMKVLPRFTGTVTERETIIKDVGEYLDALIKDKKVGKVKLDDMIERAKHNGGYLSFWP